MATVKVKFRPSAASGAPGSIVYVVTHRRVVRQISSGCRLHASEWAGLSPLSATLRCGGGASAGALERRLRRDVELLDAVIGRLSACGRGFTADDVVRTYRDLTSRMSLRRLMLDSIARLERLGRCRTAETYTAALRSFMRFCRGEDMRVNDFDAELMAEYEAYLRSCGLAMNTVSFYNRILRAVYNRAVSEGLAVQRFPFRHVYTGVGKTVKRAVSLAAIRRIRSLDLSSAPALDFARDMFLFSFYTRGMSFVDMAYLKKKNLKGGVLSYCRRKTGQTLRIRWEACMGGILAKYPANATEYLLPIIKGGGDARRQYLNAMRMVNRRLKTLAAMAGIGGNLTMYVARHSWASIARSQHIPLSVISEGMGHTSESITQIYLASLDASAIDKANGFILKKL